MPAHIPAEWAPQQGVIIVWPHHSHDWSPVLESISSSYLQMVEAITTHEMVYLIAYDDSHWQQIEKYLNGKVNLDRVQPFIIPTDDTWVRDTGPLTIFTENQRSFLDFRFNGWGNKYSCKQDDNLCQQLFKSKLFSEDPLTSSDFILEGGSIESDGQGTIMTTTSCLLNPNRNPNYERTGVEQTLKQTLGARQILWLDVEPFSGDDTDGHIDTIARFCPNQTICYVEHPANPTLGKQLKAFKNAAGESYQLVALPYPASIANAPASYANFLIINDAVLVPQYQVPEDELALKQIQHCLPNAKLYPIEAREFIEHGGSVHCLTMQIPESKT